MKTKERKKYTPEFKVQAVKLMATGKPVSELADELGVSSMMLYNWRLKSQEAHGEGSDADAVRLLRRENARLTKEYLILKKPL